VRGRRRGGCSRLENPENDSQQGMTFAVVDENGVMFRTREKMTMNLIRNKKSSALYLVLGCLLASSAAAGAENAAPLTQQESDGYLQWLHSLEKTVTAREESGISEANLLYPFDLPGWDTGETTPYRHLAISKALAMLETEYPGDSRDKIASAFLALSAARNYMNLSEYDSALVWFDISTDLDKEGHFRLEIGRERLGAALAAGDSLSMVELTTNTLGTSDLTGREVELTLVYRWLMCNWDAPTVDLLIKKVEGQEGLLTDRLLFWHAFALTWRQEYGRSLDHVRHLVQSGGLSRDLSESQRAWVLGAVPDLLYLLDNPKEAAPLYQALAECSIPTLNSWGQYQTANMAFLNSQYLLASQGFETVCKGKRAGSFQDHACAMVDLAVELQRIQSEGKPYGTAAFFTP
jgi:hypothetical protein